MNPHVPAEKLNQQIEHLVSGGSVLSGNESSSLLAIASELRLLPDPDFKQRLMADLIDEAAPLGTSVRLDEDENDPAGAAALSSIMIMPTLTGKGFSIFSAD